MYYGVETVGLLASGTLFVPVIVSMVWCRLKLSTQYNSDYHHYGFASIMAVRQVPSAQNHLLIIGGTVQIVLSGYSLSLFTTTLMFAYSISYSIYGVNLWENSIVLRLAEIRKSLLTKPVSAIFVL